MKRFSVLSLSARSAYVIDRLARQELNLMKKPTAVSLGTCVKAYVSAYLLFSYAEMLRPWEFREDESGILYTRGTRNINT